MAKEKEKEKRIITIDLDNEEIYTSNSDVRLFLESNQKMTNNMFASLNLNEFKIVKKLKKNQGRTTGDKLTLKTLKDHVKANKPELMQELEDLINSQARDKNGELKYSKNNKPIKTSFLEIKKWYYDKFPEENPKKK